jgi:hypothetical protein
MHITSLPERPWATESCSNLTTPDWESTRVGRVIRSRRKSILKGVLQVASPGGNEIIIKLRKSVQRLEPVASKAGKHLCLGSTEESMKGERDCQNIQESL